MGLFAIKTQTGRDSHDPLGLPVKLLAGFLFFLDLNDFASVVEAARWAHVVGQPGFAALRAGLDLGQVQHGVVSPAHALPARGRFTFRDAHI